MVKKFKELVLEKDTVFDDSIEVETSIRCTGNNRFSLKVMGNINAWNITVENIDAENIDARNIDALDITAWNIDALDITARNINAWNITARNINARNINARNIDVENIDAWDIDALDIDALDILCESRKKKSKTNKTIARVFIQERSKSERKEQMPEKEAKK